MLPFEKYEGKGRRLIETPLKRGSSSRTGYGLNTFERCGLTCVYCGYEMKTYKNWLNISVDHVVPINALEYWQRIQSSVIFDKELKKWIHNVSNTVTCCGACNVFLQNPINDKNPKSKPKTLNGFFNLRDQIFMEKKKIAKERHKKEKEWFDSWKKENLDLFN